MDSEAAGVVSPHKEDIHVTFARCEIIYREVNYVCFWEVYANGDKVYRFSDFNTLYHHFHHFHRLEGF